MKPDNKVLGRIYKAIAPKPMQRARAWKVDTEERNAQKVLDKISKKLGL